VWQFCCVARWCIHSRGPSLTVVPAVSLMNMWPVHRHCCSWFSVIRSCALSCTASWLSRPRSIHRSRSLLACRFCSCSCGSVGLRRVLNCGLLTLLLLLLLEIWTIYQGLVRDAKAQDRDETETFTCRDRDDETETLASPAEMRPRQDVQISRRDWDEMFVGHETSPRRHQDVRIGLSLRVLMVVVVTLFSCPLIITTCNFHQ